MIIQNPPLWNEYKLKKRKPLTKEDLAILKKYGLEDNSTKSVIEEWLSNLSYVCYIVEKNTNMTIDVNTNMVMVWDRYHSFCFEQDLIRQNSKKRNK